MPHGVMEVMKIKIFFGSDTTNFQNKVIVSVHHNLIK